MNVLRGGSGLTAMDSCKLKGATGQHTDTCQSLKALSLSFEYLGSLTAPSLMVLFVVYAGYTEYMSSIREMAACHHHNFQ